MPVEGPEKEKRQNQSLILPLHCFEQPGLELEMQSVLELPSGVSDQRSGLAEIADGAL